MRAHIECDRVGHTSNLACLGRFTFALAQLSSMNGGQVNSVGCSSTSPASSIALRRTSPAEVGDAEARLDEGVEPFDRLLGAGLGERAVDDAVMERADHLR